MEVESSTTAKITSTRTPNKRSNKPLMERRRRARINNCLTQLKSLLIQDMKKDNSHISKLEKAEILELTVRKLKKLQELINPEDNAAYREHPRYRDGFNDCISEVVDYLSKKDCMNTEFSTRVINHLNNRYTHKSKTLKQESPNRLNNPDMNSKKPEQVPPMIDCKTLKALPFNQNISVPSDGLDPHPRSLCVVSNQPSPPAPVQAANIDPQLISGHRPVQFHTNSPPQRNQVFFEMSPKHTDHNEPQMMDTSSNDKKTVLRNGPTAVDISEIIRNGGQMIGTDSASGMPIAFLVTTPLAIKAIPLYTSVDQPQKLATLSPTGTMVATPSSSPVSGLPRTPQENNIDSFEMKTDGNMSDSAYSTADECVAPNISLHNVWRPWNTQEN